MILISLQATYEAMRQAVGKLSVCPDVLLNDAVTIPGLLQEQIPIIKGDAKESVHCGSQCGGQSNQSTG